MLLGEGQELTDYFTTQLAVVMVTRPAWPIGLLLVTENPTSFRGRLAAMPRATLTGWSLACTEVFWVTGLAVILLLSGQTDGMLAAALWLLLAVGIAFGVTGLPKQASNARPLLIVSSLVIPITLMSSYPLSALTIALSALALGVLGSMLHPDTAEFLA